jgi:hypothetical protein
MTRQTSVSEIKQGRRHHSGRELPYPGTQRRRLYDWLFTHAKGIAVPIDYSEFGFTNQNRLTNEIYQIGMAYGLDVRIVGYGGARSKHPMRVILAGEWEGRAYLDYMIRGS